MLLSRLSSTISIMLHSEFPASFKLIFCYPALYDIVLDINYYSYIKIMLPISKLCALYYY